MSTPAAFPSECLDAIKKLLNISFGDAEDQSIFAEMFRKDLKRIVVNALKALPNRVTKTNLKALHDTDPYESFIFPCDEFAKLVNKLDDDKERFNKEHMEYLQTVVEDYAVKLIELAINSRENVVEGMRRSELLTKKKVDAALKAPYMYMDVQRVTNIIKEAGAFPLLHSSAGASSSGGAAKRNKRK